MRGAGTVVCNQMAVLVVALLVAHGFHTPCSPHPSTRRAGYAVAVEPKPRTWNDRLREKEAALAAEEQLRREASSDGEQLPIPELDVPLPASVGGGKHRAGFVSILGVPNVGKSTLMNAIVGERLSIATSKAQTTRHRILGLHNGVDEQDVEYQIVYSDTPGVLLPQYKLQEGMMNFVRTSIIDADVLLLVVDIFQEDISLPDEKIMRQLRAASAALIVLVNKVDLLDEDLSPKTADRLRASLGTSEEIQQRWKAEFPEATVLPVAARGGLGVDEVLRYVVALLPEHPPYFPKDQLTDKPERFFAAEMLREQIFESYSQEVPYSCEVSVRTKLACACRNHGRVCVRTCMFVHACRRMHLHVHVCMHACAHTHYKWTYMRR